MASKFGVMVGKQGQAPKIYQVGSGATVKTALLAAKIDPATATGGITVNGNAAELSTRLKANDLVSVAPKVAGGVR